MRICQSQSPSLSLPLTCSGNHVCFLHLWLFLFCISSFAPFFFRFHVLAISYDIYLSLSDLLQSVWQSLGPSMLLKNGIILLFLWLSNIQYSIVYMYHTFLVSEWPSPKKSINNKCWREYGEKGSSLYTVGGNINWCSHYGKQYGDFFKKRKTELLGCTFFSVFHSWAYIWGKP